MAATFGGDDGALARLARHPAVTGGDRDAAFAAIASEAVAALGADCVRAWLLADDRRSLDCIASAGPDAGTPTGPVAVAAAQLAALLAARAVATGGAPDGDGHDAPPPHAAGMAALLDVPIRRGAELAGLLSAGARRDRAWTQAEVALAASLGDLATLALAMHEHHRTAGRLRENQERLELILSHAGAVIFTLTDGGTIEYVSPAADRHASMAGNALVGRDWRELAHHDDQRRLLNAGARLFAGEVPLIDVEYRVQRRGAWSWLATRATLMTDAAGRQRLVGVTTDVTEAHRTRAMQRELEERLQEAQRLESVGRLAGGVAHGYNNLLTVILGSVDLALAGDVDERVRALLLATRDAGQRAAHLTRRLLAFSQRQVLDLRALDVASALAQARTLLRSAMPATIDIRIDADPGLPPVLADAQVLERIVVDLGTNAGEAMGPSGTFTITARALAVRQRGTPPVPAATPGRYVCLGFADTGRGIDPSRRATLFDPFAATDSEALGAGLGLAAIQGGVRQLHGFIDVASTPGTGTLFSILLPVADDDATATSVREAPGCPHARILVVEDEAAVRQLAVLILERAGYVADAAASVDDAVARMAADGPAYDLLITDVVMPGMDGVSLYRRLAAARPRLRVLYMSGYGRDNLPAHVRADALTAFLQKPFTVDSLTARVQALLNDTPLARPGTPG
jgi:PAS domain S-box-containing protein